MAERMIDMMQYDFTFYLKEILYQSLYSQAAKGTGWSLHKHCDFYN